MRQLILAARTALTSGHRAGVLHYVAAVFSVQGLAYLTQFAIARMVGPADFAVVRTVEATLNVLLVAASLGMPMLAVTTIAALPDEDAQGRMLGSLLALSVAGGLVAAAVAALAAGLLTAPTPGYLRALVWILALSASSRTCLNYFQGRQQIHRVARYTVLLSLLSLAIVVTSVFVAGLPGWVAGRYLSDVLFLGLLLWAVGPSLRLRGPVPGGQRIRDLLAAGAGIAVSLLVRTAGDNAGIFLLTFAGAAPATIGYFGLASLALLGLLIVPISIGSVALPRIVARLQDPAAVHRLVRRVAAGSLAVSMLLGGGAALVARPTVDLLFPTYGDAVPLLWVLVAAVPFRALSALSGMVLVACGRVGLTVWINLLALLVTVLAGAAATSPWGAVGTAWAVVAGEAIGAAAYAVATWLSLPRTVPLTRV